MIGYILAFIVGVATGAAVTFLLMYNPKKSKKTNAALIKKIDRKRRK